MRISCPNCRNSTDTELGDSQTIVCSECKSEISVNELLSTVKDASSVTRAIPNEFPEPETDQTIDHFRLDRILGNGGFGVVYKAHDLRLNRNVAIKLPRASVMTLSQAEVFLREAQAAAQLQHPNIVSVFEVGRENDRVYIVSELIEGKTLDQWRLLETPDYRAVAKLVSKIARALHVAHQVGIVHRDIKPGNIIVDAKQEPHITDFGLAQHQGGQRSAFKPGQVVGTENYMSPEQSLGNPSLIDHRSDIYSLGIVFYELLTGSRPSEIRSPQTDSKTSRRVPNELKAIALKATSADPNQRFRNCEKLADELDRWSDGLPTITLPPNRFQKTVRHLRNNSRNIGFVALGVVIGIIGIVIALSGIGRTPNDLAQHDPPPAGHKHVEFTISPPGCQLRFVKIDRKAAWVDYAGIEHLEPIRTKGDMDAFEVTLPPGWYIFEAISPDGDIAEIWRYIPENINGSPDSRYKATDWVKTGTYSVKLHPINVIPLDESFYVRCGGGSFETGADFFLMDKVPTRPVEIISLPEFLVAPYEVSLEDFHSVMNCVPFEFPDQRIDIQAHGDLAATHVRFIEAIDYAERVGGRLPMMEEYLFAASNGGKTTYPWGNEWEFHDWPIGPVGFPKEDRSEIGVYNLFSNVVEWTGDYGVPDWSIQLTYQNNGVQLDSKARSEYRETMESTRIVVGGKLGLGGSAAAPKGFDETPKNVILNPTDHQLPIPAGLGFRIYRSVVPRLDVRSDLIQYHLRNRSKKVTGQSTKPKEQKPQD